MPDAWITGTGMSPFGRFPDQALESLAAPAALGALLEADVRHEDIEALYCGNVHGGSLPGQRVARELGLTGRPVYNCEAACSSSAVALNLAVQAVRHGAFRCALVVGVEQLSVFGGGTLPLNASDHEVAQGLTMPAVYAMRAQRYLAETDATEEDLGAVAVKNRANGADNPNALLQEPVSLEEVLGSRPIADPLSLLQCCRNADGAAAVVVTDQPGGRHPAQSLRVAASVVSSGTTEPHPLASEPLTARVAEQAYEEAQVGPSDLRVVELHDAFTVAELLYYEALGLCGPGEAASLLRDGVTAADGPTPVNAGGGLIARGHPVGATGVGQVCEVAAHRRRRPSKRFTALTHCTGGGIAGFDHAACTVHVLTDE